MFYSILFMQQAINMPNIMGTETNNHRSIKTTHYNILTKIDTTFNDCNHLRTWYFSPHIWYLQYQKLGE